MTVRYLNTKGKEILIKDVARLHSLDKNYIFAVLESGIMLRFNTTGIKGIRLDNPGIDQVIINKTEEVLLPTEKRASIWSSGVLRQDNGGWGAIIDVNGEKKTLCGGKELATRQRMELTALVEALSSLDDGYCVIVKTDSRYINDAVSQGWLKKWSLNEWRRERNRSVANADLWLKLLVLLQKHQVIFDLD